MCVHVGGVHTRTESASATEYEDVNSTDPTSLMGKTEPDENVPSLMGERSLFSGSSQSDGGLTAFLT